MKNQANRARGASQQDYESWDDLREVLLKVVAERGMMTKIAHDTEIPYKRIHEIIKSNHEPSYSLGKRLEKWLLNHD